MAETGAATERILPKPGSSAVLGRIRWTQQQALWPFGRGRAGAVLFPDPGTAVAVIVLTAATIVAGPSGGVRRLLIHRSFETRSLDHRLVWLQGMAGPNGGIRPQDMCDGFQRRAVCRPHGAGVWRVA